MKAAVARALVQDVDPGNYNRALTDAAFDSYLATGDVLGMCPVARLQRDLREDGEWEMMQALCAAFDGEARSAERSLDRALGTGVAPEIDVRLAQRYAGAAGDGGRAVNIEWDGVEELTPWRFALARALGVELPESLREGAASRYDLADVHIPASPLLDRVSAADGRERAACFRHRRWSISIRRSGPASKSGRGQERCGSAARGLWRARRGRPGGGDAAIVGRTRRRRLWPPRTDRPCRRAVAGERELAG